MPPKHERDDYETSSEAKKPKVVTSSRAAAAEPGDDFDEFYEKASKSATKTLFNPPVSVKMLVVVTRLLALTNRGQRRIWAFRIGKENSIQVRRRYNLKEHMHMRWCDDYDLPRKFDSDDKLVPKHDDITAGWYCMTVFGFVKDPEKIQAAFKKLCDANYFAGTLRFEYEDIVIAKEAALSTLRGTREPRRPQQRKS